MEKSSQLVKLTCFFLPRQARFLTFFLANIQRPRRMAVFGCTQSQYRAAKSVILTPLVRSMTPQSFAVLRLI